MSTKDLTKFIPPAFRDDTNNFIHQVVKLFEAILNGKVIANSNFCHEVDNLSSYWDVVRAESLDKAKAIIDPLNISDIMVKDEKTLSRFLYMLPNLLQSKGTHKMFKYILNLCGMDADVIKWYEDDYLKYRPEKEPCRAVLVIKIGDNPLLDEMVDRFQQLAELLLDVCLTIASLILVKRLHDSVDILDTAVSSFISTYSSDVYGRCKMNLKTLYNYEQYMPYSNDWNKTEELKYLSPSQLTRYSCTNCSYVYDPLDHDRTPFNETSFDWTCPSCQSSRNAFQSTEIDPSGGISALILITSLLDNHELVNTFINTAYTYDYEYLHDGSIIGECFYNLINSFSSLSFILLENEHHEYTTNFLRLLCYIRHDDYRVLSELGLNINPASESIYFRGMGMSPYILHGDPNSSFNYFNHTFDEECPVLHDGTITHSFSSRVYDEWTPKSYDVHIKDPLLYYDNHHQILHDSSYCRGQCFDLYARPGRSCSVADYTDPYGVYSYPRHLGDITSDDPAAFFFGIADGQYKEDLVYILDYLNKNDSFMDYIKTLTNSIADIFYRGSSETLTFIKYFMEAVRYVYDDKLYQNVILKYPELIDMINLIRKFYDTYASTSDGVLVTSILKLLTRIDRASFTDAVILMNEIANNFNSSYNNSIAEDPDRLIAHFTSIQCSDNNLYDRLTDTLPDEQFPELGIIHDGTSIHNDKPIHRDEKYVITDHFKTSIIDGYTDLVVHYDKFNVEESNLLTDTANILFPRSGNIFKYDGTHTHNPLSTEGANIDVLTSSLSDSIIEDGIEFMNEFYRHDFMFSNYFTGTQNHNSDILHDGNTPHNIESRQYINGKPITRVEEHAYDTLKQYQTDIITDSYSIDDIETTTLDLLHDMYSDKHSLLPRDSNYFYDGTYTHDPESLNGIDADRLQISNIDKVSDEHLITPNYFTHNNTLGSYYTSNTKHDDILTHDGSSSHIVQSRSYVDGGFPLFRVTDVPHDIKHNQELTSTLSDSYDIEDLNGITDKINDTFFDAFDVDHIAKDNVIDIYSDSLKEFLTDFYRHDEPLTSYYTSNTRHDNILTHDGNSHHITQSRAYLNGEPVTRVGESSYDTFPQTLHDNLSDSVLLNDDINIGHTIYDPFNDYFGLNPRESKHFYDGSLYHDSEIANPLIKNTITDILTENHSLINDYFTYGYENIASSYYSANTRHNDTLLHDGSSYHITHSRSYINGGGVPLTRSEDCVYEKNLVSLSSNLKEDIYDIVNNVEFNPYDTLLTMFTDQFIFQPRDGRYNHDGVLLHESPHEPDMNIATNDILSDDVNITGGGSSFLHNSLIRHSMIDFRVSKTHMPLQTNHARRGFPDSPSGVRYNGLYTHGSEYPYIHDGNTDHVPDITEIPYINNLRDVTGETFSVVLRDQITHNGTQKHINAYHDSLNEFYPHEDYVVHEFIKSKY
jgi:rubredoxin